MKIDSVIKDVLYTLRQVVLALDNQLTARDNMAPEGTAGQVLTSNGPGQPPSYQNLPGA